MNTLTLVPIGGIWVNPEEIAAILDGSQDPKGSVIRLRGSSPVFIEGMTADEVVKQLQDHGYFTPQESMTPTPHGLKTPPPAHKP